MSSLALLAAINLSSGKEEEAGSGGVAGFEMDARETVEEDTAREGSSTWGEGAEETEEPEVKSRRVVPTAERGLAKPPHSSG